MNEYHPGLLARHWEGQVPGIEVGIKALVSEASILSCVENVTMRPYRMDQYEITLQCRTNVAPHVPMLAKENS